VVKSGPVNRLYFGDNLDVLREYIPDECVDLVYLDPPFNSQAHYNVLFDLAEGGKSSAQAGAFRDTWMWGDEAEWAFSEVMRVGGGTARFIDALRAALKESDMMAYLAMMAVRLRELHQKLKPTGSLYLHCDPTASHYLKILLDGIFGPDGFRSEIIWKRTTAHNDAKHQYPDVTDTILFYAKGPRATFNRQFLAYDQSYLDSKYRHKDADGRIYRLDNLRSPQPRPNLTYTYKGHEPHPNGWAVSKEKMADLDRNGLLDFPRKAGGRIQLKRYLDKMPGLPVTNLWDDIHPVNAMARERLGYPTQKPLTLLERIIQTSSNEGDLILDPFCGCGTTIEASERLKREWIGIDVAVHAIKVIEGRLLERLGDKVKYQIEGMPRDFESAVKLAERDKYQFQWWANYLFNPHAIREQKKGADRGVDGELFFPNGPGRPWGRMLTSVKGGEQVGPSMVRDFGRVLEREEAQLGLFICLRPPTREMIREAASVGLAKVVHGDIPKLQIVAIEDWFKGKIPLLPPLEHLPSAAFAGRRRPAAQAKRTDPDQPELPLSFKGGKEVKRHFNLRMVSGAA
jgi:site-specific DNA-methyltransferase (adenine-specific)